MENTNIELEDFDVVHVSY